ncbi:REST corepressor isoform X4 [Aphelenchoides besseyi]|nr:REST corepressor isoform X4 [Aphelenchoides besseyi]
MTETEETANISEVVVNSRPASASSSSELDDGGASTPASVRKTRSSGPLILKDVESVPTTRRSVRKRDDFMKSAVADHTRVGNQYQTMIPELIIDPADDQGKKMEKAHWKPKEWKDDFDDFCELARVCRKVPMDIALKHIYDCRYNLEQALIDFEKLPVLDSLRWTSEELKSLVKKVIMGRKVVAIQKHFTDLGKKTGAQVFEKRCEIIHRLCYGPTRYLCPQFLNNTTEFPVVYRKNCENCRKELHKTSGDKSPLDEKRELCNCCHFYAKLTGRYRPFSTSIAADQLIAGGFEKVEEHHSDDEHYDCFAEPDLNEIRKPVAWTLEEEETCIVAFRQYGLDFKAVADKLPNKTDRHVQQFYVANRRRYSIDAIAEDRERERDTPPVPRLRRIQEEDRTPTPAVESGEEKEVEGADGPSARVTRKSQPVEGTA